MKINIITIPDLMEEEINISCHSNNRDKMLEIAEKFKEANGVISGKKDGRLYRIKLSNVFYFEVLDEKLFIYCEKEVYENRMRLYEVEQLCSDSLFFRASKSMLVNVDKIKHMKPSLSGRFEVELTNDETIIVSRKYVADLKRRIIG